MASFKFPTFKSEKYKPILDKDHDAPSEYSDESGATLEPTRTPIVKRRTNYSLYAITLVLAGLATFFFAQNFQLRKRGNFQNGFANEIAFATPLIQVYKTKFTGGIKFHDNGTMFRDQGPGKQYVGQPSPELDAHWEELVHTRYLAFTASQKNKIQVEMDQSDEDALYRAGPDVFHSLHCVNKLRQTLDGYMYNLTEQVDESVQNVMHLEHCLDFLRQLIQCGSDLTPIPLVFSKGAGFAVPDFEQVHTCRAFEPIREWADKQNLEALRSVGKEEYEGRVP
ncbi:hypothetical protein CC86DRAFT_368017 [Ophiobolus disseminans]|uniref:Uncharacterized protein n=1 Tax=Ophiobolus disseminans TaxID=1469910 RepID=A0A6A7ABS2_9PLEO|nr:hypothetical protein CC86DRAFT_368017 [Ophiobolus disseminans]